MVIIEKPEKLKNRELKIREMKIRESQNLGSSKSGKPKIQEAIIWSLYGLKKGEVEMVLIM